jgi:ribosomal protein S18 acetylase RimI-like enzyme
MIAVHDTLQSLGIGTALIDALERRAEDAGCVRARMSVEHDNPRALALYRRLGYADVGSEVESWPVTGDRTYVTVSTVVERAL